MVAVFVLLTLAAMEVITVGLLDGLRTYYVATEQGQLLASLRTDTVGVEQQLQVDGEAAAEAWVQDAPGVNNGALATTGQTLTGAGAPSPTGAAPARLVLLDDTQHCVATNASSGCSSGLAYRLASLGLGALVQGEAQACSNPGPGGFQTIWCGRPVIDPNTNRTAGYLLAWTQEQGIYQTILQIRQILFTWTVVALVVMGILGYLLARTITGPIQALTRRVRAMAAGDLTGELLVQSRDEVGQLAAVFNQMSRRLRETLDAIRAEQRRAAAIVENMADGILALDARGGVIVCNPSAAAMLGRDPGSIQGKGVAEAVPELAPVLNAPPPVAPEALDGPQVPAVLVRVQGRELLIRVAPLEDGGVLRGTVVVLQDVTARERLEALRKEFVANVSHELRTPVTTVKLYAESLLEWGIDDPEVARDKVSVIANETDRMDRLIRDLLQLSRLDHRRELRPRRRVDLADLAGSVVGSLRESARRKGVRISLECSADLLEVPADPDAFVQVLNNLLINALDFTPEGGEVTVALLRPSPDHVRVQVADTGPGIPESDLTRIFDRFYRVDASRNREHGGSGLGLAIAKELVEAHCGTIGVESIVGQGSTFWFTLPVEVAGG